jgi:hypothetical protein
MKTIIATIQVIGILGGVAAIVALSGHCVGEALALYEKRIDDLGRMDDWAWAGLLFLALWLACQIGVIGLVQA